MKSSKSSLIALVCGILTAWLLASSPLAHAATIWTGAVTNFAHSNTNGNPQDQWTTGVRITRLNLAGQSGGLYNSVTESGATVLISPADTKWAIGALSNFNTLTYGACPLEAGNNPPHYITTNFVVHLINEDIYLSLKLTAWGGVSGFGDKIFAYTRSTPPPPTPTISITNPAGGAVFAAPANVSIGADAAVSGGTVTNVQFFTNNILLGSDVTAPFSFAANNLAAGAYALKAAATAGGISSTSAVVNVSVVTPVAVTLSGATANNGQFSFSYTANPGLTYVVQTSSNLLNWVFLVTNVAPGSPVPFTNAMNPTGAGFYRVGRLPNP